MSSQPSIETVAESFSGQVPIRLNPSPAPLARTLHPLARGAVLDPQHALSVFFPVKFEA
jgi:hypothetical protein